MTDNSSTLAPAAELPPGSLLGEYRVISLERTTPEALIYVAEHLRLPRRMVVEVWTQTLKSDDEEARFRERCGRISAIQEPHIAQLIDLGVLDDKRPYFVYEWLDGVPLGSEGDLVSLMELADRFAILRAVAEALDQVHTHGLQLGALSANHILIEQASGQARLMAFAPVAPSGSAEENDTDYRCADYRSFGRILSLLFAEAQERIEAEELGEGETLATAAMSPKSRSSGKNEAIRELIERCDSVPTSAMPTSASEIARELHRVLRLEKPEEGVLARGTIVGNSYRITALIGRGGMGHVYEATHVRLPQRVAIKVISGKFTEEALVRFQREAEIASSLGHPHIVRVADFNTLDNGRPYIVMEYLDGEDLSKAIRSGPLAPERALRIAGQIGSALSAVHKQGIIHRDLKPPNIHLRKVEIAGEMREHATVLDFGVSKHADTTSSVTKTEAIVGTPSYMAPEQALGYNDNLTAKADQFSLGCLLYEMLSGAPPFGKGALAEVVYRVCHEEPTPLSEKVPGLSKAVVAAIARAMSKEADDRFDTVANFVAALGADEAAPELEDESAAADSIVTGDVTLREGPALEVRAGHRGKTAAPSRGSPGPKLALALAGTATLALALAAGLGLFNSEPSASSVEMNQAIDAGAMAKASALEQGKAASTPSDAAPIHDAQTPADAAAKAATAKRPAPKTLSASAAAVVSQARENLNAGRYEEARTLINRNKEAALSADGSELIVMSFCGQGRFGPAQDWLERVPRAKRQRVRDYCKGEHDIDLR